MKITGITILLLTTIITGIIFYIKYKTNNVRDEKKLAAYIDKDANKFIAEANSYGLVIGVFKQGKTYIKGYGTIENGQTMLPDSTTVFELASTSKIFTTSTLQLLIDTGELKPDDKIQNLLFDKVKLPASAQNTTLLHLATHLSGFPGLPNSFIAKMTDETNPYAELITSDIYNYLSSCEGKNIEGTFEYSNFGMGLLGHLLELRTSEKYEQLVKNRLLFPLKMTNTFITPDSSNKDKIIQGYNDQGQKTPVWADHVLTGAGSFLSNATDMIKFIKANLSENATTISKSLLKTHLPQLKSNSGLGWMLPDKYDRLIGNQNIVWHNGMAGGYASFMAIDKANNYGMIILSNKAVDVTKLGMKLTLVVRSQSWEE
ncbi:MAG: beta-lactamase family protein [Bacteroidia bacterium]|nr:beta-lactamase family protein [Bacteroidia bacterium]